MAMSSAPLAVGPMPVDSTETHHNPIVKNTFIEVENRLDLNIRRGSVPAALRLLREEECQCVLVRTNSEASTCISEGASSLPERLDTYIASCSDPVPSNVTLPRDQSIVLPPPRPLNNSNAGSWKPCYRNKLDKVIKRFAKLLEDHESIASVSVSEDDQDCSVKACAMGGIETRNSVASFAKQALLQSASQCKCIYVMGYCARAFLEHPWGVEASVGAMENATRACWHVFKKGHCRHEVNCSKQHPIHTATVRIIIECAPVERRPTLVPDFKLLLAGLVHTVRLALERNPSVTSARATEDIVSNSWTIELRGALQKQDFLLEMARIDLLNVVNSSKAVRIIEHAGQAVTYRKHSFVVVLSESGLCHLDQASCLVPINVVVAPE